MSRPSSLYKRLGLTGPDDALVNVIHSAAPTVPNLGDNVHSISISRGGSDISSYNPSTCTIETPQNVELIGAQDLQVRLTAEAASLIGAATGEDPQDIIWRWRGRVATQTAHDKQLRRGQPAAWRGTTLVGAGWGSIYEHSPNVLTPTAGMTLQQAAQQLLQPGWASNYAVLDWNGNTDEWPAPPPETTHDQINASDLLSILSGRLYGLSDDRLGNFRVSALDYIKNDAQNAAVTAWPLARAHVLAPTVWDQPSRYPTEYRVQLLDPFGNIDEIIIAPDGIPTGHAKLVDQDWTDIVATTDQWRRLHGLRWESFQTAWRLPSIEVRLDHLIASPYEAHRRAAGMLLRLNVADPVALAGDWPGYIDGIHIVTSLDETMTPDAWTLTVGLMDYRGLDGGSQFPIKPRTWAQAGARTWDDAGAATWNEGVPA